MKKSKLIYFIFILISLTNISIISAVRINEIMYKPNFNEKYNEWVELYNDENETINLEEFKLCGRDFLPGYIDRQGNVHREEGLILEVGKFAIISDGGSGTEAYDNYDVDVNVLSISVDASSLCGGLTNSGKTIILEKNNQTYQEFTYSDIAKKGYSLEYINGVFLESRNMGGSPGRENIFNVNEDLNEENISQDNEDKGENITAINYSSQIESQQTTQTTLSTNQKTKTITLETINLNTKDIKIKNDKKYLNKSNYAIYGFIAFCILLGILFLVKKNKKYKTEFEE